ncbi:MAG: hypothetical protein AAF004_02985 [Pseudomonadota bacterium]
MLKRAKKELIIVAIVLSATVLIVLPLVYVVGGKTLGAYGGSSGMTGYIADVFRSLGSGDGAMWFFMLSPILALTLLRAGMGVARRVR